MSSPSFRFGVNRSSAPNYKAITFFSIGIMVFLIFFYKPNSLPLKSLVFYKLQTTLDSANKAFRHVAVGYNSCLDLLIPAAHAINQLNLNGNVVPVLHDKIKSAEDLLETFAYSFEHGSAVERFIDNRSFCQNLIAKSSSLEDREYFPGGNAALMAINFVHRGSKVILGGVVGEKSKRFFPRQLKFANKMGNDEIHLIMEFKRGEKWGTFTAPRDNRLIVHCDSSNSRLEVLEGFHEALLQFNPDLVVISGLHLLESESKVFRVDRLNDVASHISPIENIPIHLELASIANGAFITQIGNIILPNVDSLGLNEQELGYLFVYLGGHSISQDKVNDYIKEKFKDPTVEVIADALSYILDNKKFHRLTRIHFHTLKFHIVAQKAGSPWEPGRESVAAGSLVASVQSCQFNPKLKNPEEEFTLPFYEGKDKTEGEVLQSWTNGEIEFYLAPVLVCKSPFKTVGLGDAISSLGLLYHEWRLHKLE